MSPSWYFVKNFSISSSPIRLQFYFILFVSGICDFLLGDHNVVSGYLLFPSKSVHYLASWCI